MAKKTPTAAEGGENKDRRKRTPTATRPTGTTTASGLDEREKEEEEREEDEGEGEEEGEQQKSERKRNQGRDRADGDADDEVLFNLRRELQVKNSFRSTSLGLVLSLGFSVFCSCLLHQSVRSRVLSTFSCLHRHTHI